MLNPHEVVPHDLTPDLAIVGLPATRDLLCCCCIIFGRVSVISTPSKYFGDWASVGETKSARAKLAIFLFFLVTCFAGGGGARVDVVSLLYLRPLAVFCLVAFVVLPGDRSANIGNLRIPFVLLTALAASIAVQLIPLPHDWWAAMPGHGPFAEVDKLTGMDAVYRPISLTPDLTLTSLVSLIIPLTALVGFASLSAKQRYFLLLPTLSLIFVSALFGVLQVAGGSSSPAYLYAVTNFDSPTGLLANRNHQALVLSMGLPLLRLWTLMPTRAKQVERISQIGAACGAVFLVVMIVVTGSRAGLGLCLLALGGAVMISPPDFKARLGGRGRLVAAVIGVATLGLIGVFSLFGRAFAIQRLFSGEWGDDARVKYLPTVMNIIRDFLPFGSGFGSFDPVMRAYEPDALLNPYYFNHAHNDLLELVLTGGIFAALVGVGFLVWFGQRAWAAYFGNRALSVGAKFRRAASLEISLVLLASLVDYPMRVPLIAALFAMAVGWLSTSKEHAGRRAGVSSSC